MRSSGRELHGRDAGGAWRKTRYTAQLTNFVGTSPAVAARVDALCELLNSVGLSARACAAIDGELWGKGVVNAAINPLTALWRVPNGNLLVTPERRGLLADLVAEAAAVGPGARHHPAVGGSAGAHREDLPGECGEPFLHAPGHHTTAGQPGIDSINGVIVSEGRRLGVPVPLNEAMWRLVWAMGEVVR